MRRRRSSGDAIIFLHGFGCSSEMFAGAYDAAPLQEFGLYAIDFPSHGDSSPLDPAVTSLECYAAVIRDALKSELCQYGRIHLVCHSMGGAVGLIAAESIERLGALVSVEGNLIGEDCGIVSRSIAEQSRSHFIARGYAAFKAELAASDRPDCAEWLKSYARCEPAGLHEISRSLVEWSDSGKLLRLFTGLEDPHYVYGRQSRLAYLLPRLEAIPRHAIPAAGHFAMLDNPGRFYQVVGQIARGTRERRARPARESRVARRPAGERVPTAR